LTRFGDALRSNNETFQKTQDVMTLHSDWMNGNRLAWNFGLGYAAWRQSFTTCLPQNRELNLRLAVQLH